MAMYPRTNLAGMFMMGQQLADRRRRISMAEAAAKRDEKFREIQVRQYALNNYLQMLDQGVKPEDAGMAIKQIFKDTDLPPFNFSITEKEPNLYEMSYEGTKYLLNKEDHETFSKTYQNIYKQGGLTDPENRKRMQDTISGLESLRVADIPPEKEVEEERDIRTLDKKLVEIPKEGEPEVIFDVGEEEPDEGRRFMKVGDKLLEIHEEGPPTVAWEPPKEEEPVKATPPKELFARADKLRNEFIQQSKVFVGVRDAFNRIVASGQEPSAAGDLALIFNYMKILDPESVVREGEFATAANAGGVSDRIRAMYNKVVSGKRLSPAQRADFLNRSQMLFNKQIGTHKNLRQEYERLSGQYGIPTENVVLDYLKDAENINIDPYDVGAVYEDADGNRKRYMGNGKWEDVK